MLYEIQDVSYLCWVQRFQESMRFLLENKINSVCLVLSLSPQLYLVPCSSRLTYVRLPVDGQICRWHQLVKEQALKSLIKPLYGECAGIRIVCCSYCQVSNTLETVKLGQIDTSWNHRK